MESRHRPIDTLKTEVVRSMDGGIPGYIYKGMAIPNFLSIYIGDHFSTIDDDNPQYLIMEDFYEK